jgi:ABC-type ATPase involved in cell division
VTQALITFADVGKRYPGGKDALLGASFSVDAGEFVGLQPTHRSDAERFRLAGRV